MYDGANAPIRHRARMAHQWWAHQVIGAGVQGQTLLMESLSQYSALMVMEKEYGRQHMHRFLRYELDRYLRGRGGELIEEQPLLEELFARMVFYDHRVVAASGTPRNGKYDISIEYQAAKTESDGLGRESPLAVNDWIEIGVFARDADENERTEKPLYLQRHHITQGRGTIKVTVAAAPFEVGFDPYNKLIDRVPDDNRMAVDVPDAPRGERPGKT